MIIILLICLFFNSQPLYITFTSAHTVHWKNAPLLRDLSQEIPLIEEEKKPCRQIDSNLGPLEYRRSTLGHHHWPSKNWYFLQAVCQANIVSSFVNAGTIFPLFLSFLGLLWDSNHEPLSSEATKWATTDDLQTIIFGDIAWNCGNWWYVCA